MAYTNKLNVWANTSNNVEDSDTLASSSTPGKGAGLGFGQGNPIYSDTFNGILKEATLVTKALIDALNDPTVTSDDGTGNIDNTIAASTLTTYFKGLLLNRIFTNVEVDYLSVNTNAVLEDVQINGSIDVNGNTVFNYAPTLEDGFILGAGTSYISGDVVIESGVTPNNKFTFAVPVDLNAAIICRGSETHSGQETHNGIETHYGAMTIISSKPSAAGSAHKERLGSGSDGIVLTGQFIRRSNIERSVNLVDAIRNITYIDCAKGSDISYYGAELNKNNIVDFLQERVLRIEYRYTLGTSYPVIWIYNDIFDKLIVKYLKDDGSYAVLFDTSVSSTETINGYISELKYTYYTHYDTFI